MIRLLLMFACVSAAPAQTLCARVGVQLSQDAVVSRNAFRGTLTITNERDEYLSAIGVTLEIKDPQGDIQNVHFSGLDTPIVGGTLDRVDGTGTLPPRGVGSSQWTMIPYDDAAPAGPIVYGFGGTLTYTSAAGTVTVPLTPVYLTVVPNPHLVFKYFWERDVFSDDPLTEGTVEPTQPFSVGVMVSNTGAGFANNLRITSAQPRITRNDRGLLINFNLLGTQVGCEVLSPSLLAPLGNFEPGATKMARWLMSSTLSGHFTDYQVRYEHIDGLGDRRLSLVELDSPEGKAHELIHSVIARGTEFDCAPDFLVSDSPWFTNEPDPNEDPSDPDKVHLPDTIHMSDGTTRPVTPILTGIATPNPNGTITIRSAMAPANAWTYLRVPDPIGGRYRVTRAVRADGREIDLANVWQTDRLFRDNAQTPIVVNRIHLFDRGGPGEYTLFLSDSGDPPRVQTIASLADHGTLAAVGLSTVPSRDLVEPRILGLGRLKISFSKPMRDASLLPGNVVVNGVGAENQPIDLSGVSWGTSVAADGRSVEIAFAPALPDRARYCVSLIGATDDFGNVIGANNRFSITALTGDATSDSRTNNTDAGAIQSLMGVNPIDSANERHVRADINNDGRIDAADRLVALQHRSVDLRFVPSPCPGGRAGGDGPVVDNSLPPLDPDIPPPGIRERPPVRVLRASITAAPGTGGVMPRPKAIAATAEATSDPAMDADPQVTLAPITILATDADGLTAGYRTLDRGMPAAAVWSADTGLVDLNDLLSPADGWRLLRADGFQATETPGTRLITGEGTFGGVTTRFGLTIMLIVEAGGDLDGNGSVDEADLTLLLTFKASGDPCCDVNGDGVINNSDVEALISLIADK